MSRWTWIAVLLAVVFFALALNNDVYALTSPWHLSWHVVLRKAYSVVAFGLVAYAGRRAFDDHGLSRNPVWIVLAVAAYSALIELGQALMGSNEGLSWNAVDVACGALGGLLGDSAERVVRAATRRSVRARPPR